MQTTSFEMMRTHGARFSVVVLAMLVAASLFAAKPARAETFTVNYKGDATDDLPGDGSCNAGFGLCSLRAAIEEANAYPDGDAIHFGIPGGGVQTILPNSELPEITGRVTIDGYTQPGAKKNTLAGGTNAVLRVQLDGSGAVGSYVDGFVVSADDAVLRGLVINRFGYCGVLIYGDNSRIEGNFIGTNATGTRTWATKLTVWSFLLPPETSSGAPRPQRATSSPATMVAACISLPAAPTRYRATT